MKKDTPTQSCGSCKWWEVSHQYRWGLCHYPMPFWQRDRGPILYRMDGYECEAWTGNTPDKRSAGAKRQR